MGIKWLLFTNIVLLGFFVGVPLFEEVIHHIIEKYKEIGKGKMIASIVLIIIAVISTATAFCFFDSKKTIDETTNKVFSTNEGRNVFILPDSNNKVSSDYFVNRNTINSIHFYDSNTDISPSTFSGCKNLETVKLPSNLKEIKNLTFAYCTKLNSIKIPNSVKKIGDEAFLHCETLNGITIKGNIGRKAFAECRNLLSIDLDKSTREISDRAFKNCTGLEYITLSSKDIRLNISRYAFLGIANKIEIKLKNGTPLSINDLHKILQQEKLGNLPWLKLPTIGE